MNDEFKRVNEQDRLNSFFPLTATNDPFSLTIDKRYSEPKNYQADIRSQFVNSPTKLFQIQETIDQQVKNSKGE